MPKLTSLKSVNPNVCSETNTFLNSPSAMRTFAPTICFPVVGNVFRKTVGVKKSKDIKSRTKSDKRMPETLS